MNYDRRGGWDRWFIEETPLVSPYENKPSSPDLTFWIQFTLLWQRLADMSYARREEYLEKAKTCMARAEIITSRLSTVP
jgi:hypothetical protein